MRRFPEPIQNLAAAFTALPGVGSKTALRYVYALLALPRRELEQLSRLVRELGERIEVCPECRSYTEGGLCEICRDSRRDQRLLCIVETSRDIATLEASGAYRGRYFVLGGTLNPLEGFTPDVLPIRNLMEKIQASNGIEELILAFSPDVHGETTMLYLARELKPLHRRVTRLARGLPTGAAIEFADEVTLGDALQGRKEI
ncbi:MAG TPA: recombination mediator RecR [Patescibacteria group bacterium]|nr:recombination mediator RecR [Patescibacteria group bacterium]